MTEYFFNASKLINYLFEKKYLLKDKGVDNINWQKPSGNIPYNVSFGVANKDKFCPVTFNIVTIDGVDLVRGHSFKLLDSKLSLKEEDRIYIYI